jgi:hypothetical protein
MQEKRRRDIALQRLYEVGGEFVTSTFPFRVLNHYS